MREWEGKERRGIEGIWFLLFGLIFEKGKERIWREREGKGLVVLLSYGFRPKVGNGGK